MADSSERMEGRLARLIIGIVLSASGMGCGFIASYEYWTLQSEVNERLPDGQKFEPLFWTLSTHIKLRRLCRVVLPESPRPRRALRFTIVGFVLFFLGAALCFGWL